MRKKNAEFRFRVFNTDRYSHKICMYAGRVNNDFRVICLFAEPYISSENNGNTDPSADANNNNNDNNKKPVYKVHVGKRATEKENGKRKKIKTIQSRLERRRRVVLKDRVVFLRRRLYRGTDMLASVVFFYSIKSPASVETLDTTFLHLQIFTFTDICVYGYLRLQVFKFTNIYTELLYWCIH